MQNYANLNPISLQRHCQYMKSTHWIIHQLKTATIMFELWTTIEHKIQIKHKWDYNK